MIKAAIFDLGNVLLHFDHRIIRDRLSAVLGQAADEKAATREFQDIIGDFERGMVTPDQFLSRVMAQLEVEHLLDAGEFASLWSDIFWKNEELVSMLPGLAERIRLVLLSNTNALHLEFARRQFPEVFAPFRNTVFSFETQLAKPDRRIFEKAVILAEAQPAECLYFDDIDAYVRIAAGIGIHAYQYVSVDAVRDILSVYEISPVPREPRPASNVSDP